MFLYFDYVFVFMSISFVIHLNIYIYIIKNIIFYIYLTFNLFQDIFFIFLLLVNSPACHVIHFFLLIILLI